jgi:hypothetical protein
MKSSGRIATPAIRPLFLFDGMRHAAAMRTLWLLPLLLLAACGQSDSDPGPGGVTVGEARALDEAAAMLDKRRLPPEATVAPPPTPSKAPGK